ncbi:hypothetical protein SAMN05446037_104913 [Anaerovirgula multivorans]|uniref:Phage portal protein n=1 Tax=Anaerovirgula multivorans TaxID=312168 RepID=A0A239KN36_9FIRM|nr:putative phage tail protein [Anaerovirgula multivorans]SNT18584.1 hypothetical protein SAMN05446037_104913 [Anaerovirgula multivorans]
MNNSLMKFMPEYYRTSKVATNLINVEEEELQSFKKKLEETLNQFYVDTSTFTLERWEREVGIPVNNTKPAAYRRSVIKSKIRGSGTITVKLIKNVSESFTNGEVEVIENPECYSFTIRFISVMGVPPNIDDLKEAIEEIKPAHLMVEYSYRYLIWNDFDNAHKTWDQWDALNLTWDEFEIYKEGA